MGDEHDVERAPESFRDELLSNVVGFELVQPGRENTEAFENSPSVGVQREQVAVE